VFRSAAAFKAITVPCLFRYIRLFSVPIRSSFKAITVPWLFRYIRLFSVPIRTCIAAFKAITVPWLFRYIRLFSVPSDTNLQVSALSLLPMKFLAPLVVLIAFVFSSCEPDVVYTPRPRGYFRIELPPKNYVQYDSADVPYTMEIPDYSRMFRSSAPDAPATWKDLYFGEFKATLYLSYHEITSDSLFAQLINQSWELTEAHHEMSQAMKDSMILRPEDKVYGTVIELGGNAASLLQFYLTDSTHHFIRGSLYFYAAPNKDSLQPVLKYIKDDVMHIVQTLKWKEQTGQQEHVSPNITAYPEQPKQRPGITEGEIVGDKSQD
jgi:gliding motility-associated lipoprotein GldD